MTLWFPSTYLEGYENYTTKNENKVVVSESGEGAVTDLK